MHPYMAEVMAKTRLHQGAGAGIQRLSGRAQHLMDDRRNFLSSRMVDGLTLQHLFLLLSAGVALAASLGMAPTGAFTLQQPGRYRSIVSFRYICAPISVHCRYSGR